MILSVNYSLLIQYTSTLRKKIPKGDLNALLFSNNKL